MTHYSLLASRTRLLNRRELLLTGAALALGLAAAYLPPAQFALAVLVISTALLSLITPLAALGVLLIAAPLRTLIATESAIPLPLDIGQLLLLAVFGVWIAHRIARSREIRLNIIHPVFLAVLVFTLATGASGLVAQSASAWLNEWLKWVQICTLILLCLDIARGSQWQWIIFLLVAAACANALVGVYEFFGGSGALHLLIDDRFFRAFGTFGQPNPFGGFMGLTAPLAAGMTAGCALKALRQYRVSKHFARVAFQTAFYSAATLLLTIGVLISWSRGAWLSLALAYGACIFALPRRLWHSVLLVGAVAAFVIGLWVSGRLPASVVERLESVTRETILVTDVRGVDITPENYALIERLAHWQAAIQMAEANPWLGVGFGNYETAYEQYRLINWKFALGHAHNYYLNVLAETGIIGLLAYAVMWCWIIALTWRARRHPDPAARMTAVGLFGTWIYLASHSLTDNLFVNNVFLHLGAMFGLLAALDSQIRSKPWTNLGQKSTT